MKSSDYLQWVSGFVITLIVLYSISLVFVAIIFLLLVPFIISLFSKELFTQQGEVIFIGAWIYLIGGLFILLGTLALQGVYVKLKWSRGRFDECSKRPGYDKRLLLFVLIAVLSSWALSATLFIDSSDEFTAVTIIGTVLLLLSFLNWKVVDIPARALAITGDTTGLKISAIAAVPMVVLGMSFVPLISALQFENAPTETIISSYLEALFALGVVCTFIGLIRIQIRLSKRIDALEQENE